MSKAKLQDCIDSAGRLAAFIDALGADCVLEDVLVWCSESNVALSTDTKLANEALDAIRALE